MPASNQSWSKSEHNKRGLPKRTDPFIYIGEFNYSSIAACAAANRAIGTLNGEQEA